MQSTDNYENCAPWRNKLLLTEGEVREILGCGKNFLQEERSTGRISFIQSEPNGRVIQLCLSLLLIGAGGGLNKLIDARRRWQTMARKQKTLPTEIHINTAEIPDAVRDRLAVATMAFVRSILKQPGGREALEARIALKR